MAEVLDWRTALMLAAILGSGAAAYVSWKNTPVGQLEWNGEAWRWESSSYQTGIAEQQLFVIVDLQHTLLLRLENQANANLWIWAQRSSFSERWLDLRRAAFATRKESSISIGKKLGPPLQLSSETESAGANLVNGVALKP